MGRGEGVELGVPGGRQVQGWLQEGVWTRSLEGGEARTPESCDRVHDGVSFSPLRIFGNGQTRTLRICASFWTSLVCFFVCLHQCFVDIDRT